MTRIHRTAQEIRPIDAEHPSPAPDAHDTGDTRRPYDSPLRRERAARTRDRILAAGSELVHGLTTWDWRGLTFRAVAERAGVSERTVYRHFPTEHDLHEAIMRRLGEESGVTYTGLSLTDLAPVTARVLASLPSYAVRHWDVERPQEPALAAVEHDRREALVAAVAAAAATWPEDRRRMAVAILDLFWDPGTFERLATLWQLDAGQAGEALTWAVEVIAAAVRDGRPMPGDDRGAAAPEVRRGTPLPGTDPGIPPPATPWLGNGPGTSPPEV
ncbi:TetR/AcrR family transcriptional regulator [Nocardia sp. alder85J]|uniref:TetR/AcrR family transcriptional regulator n=1 Tax=Nocardia sp. alder85J TaxID=2862949 RepID=UPI001CD2F390|nr:TetR/AcrR family transcriptional regulator [Nocardia sp. alder85J]MCX4094759.1 TetR/AcrR family transcriptional regulator [Nocardia sp. alder85J]